MSVFSILERSVQDAANVANAAGASGGSIIQLATNCLPGPTIKRSLKNLHDTSVELQKHYVPNALEDSYWKKHNKLWNETSRLKEETKRAKGLKSLTFMTQAHRNEKKTSELCDEVQQSSSYFLSKLNRCYAESTHTTDSEWVTDLTVPASPTLPPMAEEPEVPYPPGPVEEPAEELPATVLDENGEHIPLQEVAP